VSLIGGAINEHGYANELGYEALIHLLSAQPLQALTSAVRHHHTRSDSYTCGQNPGLLNKRHPSKACSEVLAVFRVAGRLPNQKLGWHKVRTRQWKALALEIAGFVSSSLSLRRVSTEVHHHPG